MVSSDFEEFFNMAEVRLRAAFVARYGPSTGRAVAVDSLSYAWENWERLRGMENPLGYLFRVGQSASRRYVTAHAPWSDWLDWEAPTPDFVPELAQALSALPERQRTVVVLVEAMGWTQREVARLLEITPSTVQTHLERGLRSLRSALEVSDA